jgi:hypothetical protein
VSHFGDGAAMTKPLISYRRIDQLKAIALDRGFSNEDAKQFGKLSKTATWEALLKTHGIPLQAVDSVDKNVDTNIQSHDTSGWTNDGSFPVCDFTRPNSSFLDWVDFGQLVALVLASAGLFVLAMSMWRQINPLNLFPQSKSTFKSGQNYELTTAPF